jgi:hypothetical protein
VLAHQDSFKPMELAEDVQQNVPLALSLHRVIPVLIPTETSTTIVHASLDFSMQELTNARPATQAVSHA